MPIATRAAINEFLNQKRIAIVGVSRDPKHFSRIVYAEFRKRGYDVRPVNPGVKEIDGQPCYARVQDIAAQLDGVLIMTAPHVTDQVVRDCEAAGVQRVWMHKGEGIGAVSKSAVEFCQQRGISVIDGQCPFMFLPQAVFFHRAHGFVKKMMGSYLA